MDNLDLITDNPLLVSGGLIIAIVLGYPVKWILDAVTEEIDESPPDDFRPADLSSDQVDSEEIRIERWKDAIAPPGESAGVWLGRLERVGFYLAFVVAAYEVVLGWLAFKVASKWSVWQNIVKVQTDEDASYEFGVQSRRGLGSRVMQRFLIGTLANIVAAAIVFALVVIIASRN